MAWFYDAMRGPDGPVVAVCHGGPIAAICGTLAGAPVADWPGLVPNTGEIVTLEDLSP
jgi:broad specificity phosphatase PhoE